MILLQTAKMHLEKAIEVAAREGCAVTEIEIAEHHYKLVRGQGGNLTEKKPAASTCRNW